MTIKKLTLNNFIEEYSGAALDDQQLVDACMSRLKPGTPLYNRAVVLFLAREDFLDFLEEVGFEVG
jgi:hypothetical protein